MSTKRMLIDAAQPEETRVAIIEDSRLIDHDVEVAARRQLKGNIYLAKVTRVEPSLQAAFVDYGGNRHGFLAFNEIHPDYYQIPVADRQALLAEQQAQEAEASESDEGEEESGIGDGNTIAEDEELEPQRPRLTPRHYKIQEVIKRRQIMLVQVAKEERGTKGAALTTYLSLAGRYCVLMPNTTRGGGISRKITNLADRKRLKKIISELAVPEGMAVILRTAGSERSKAEIKRDYEYLMRLWAKIRELTLSSIAPTLVYEEGSLIKRSIRDMYDRAIEEILVEGEAAYRISKDFMKLVIPSHAKRVKPYDGSDCPLFQRFGVEAGLEANHSPVVELKSGGSIVINPTEALVAIDVNSGRSTRERHIEETALRTNLEACDEIARQLRLRDLAGLIVIDFIDMEVTRNQGQVERRLKEAMKNDRARIQFGRISPFGLLEMSRQRLRPSLIETSYETCPTCGGMGVRRTTESAALSVLRRIEAEAINDNASRITVTAPASVAMYLLNEKRPALYRLEQRYDLSIAILEDDQAAPTFDVERSRPVEEREAPDEDAEAGQEETEAGAGERDDAGRRSKRRRPRRRKRTEDAEETPQEAASDDAETEEDEVGEERAAGAEEDDQDSPKKRRRRGKRGGRRRVRKTDDEEARPDDVVSPVGIFEGLPSPGTLLAAPDAHERLESPTGEAASAADDPEPSDTADSESGATPRRPRRRRSAAGREKRSSDTPSSDDSVIVVSPEAEAEVVTASEAEPQDVDVIETERNDQELLSQGDDDPRPAKGNGEDDATIDRAASRTEVIEVGGGDEAASDQTRRRGWWQRFIN